jgi:hypothetical protein
MGFPITDLMDHRQRHALDECSMTAGDIIGRFRKAGLCATRW